MSCRWWRRFAPNRLTCICEPLKCRRQIGPAVVVVREDSAVAFGVSDRDAGQRDLTRQDRADDVVRLSLVFRGLDAGLGHRKEAGSL